MFHVVGFDCSHKLAPNNNINSCSLLHCKVQTHVNVGRLKLKLYLILWPDYNEDMQSI